MIQIEVGRSDLGGRAVSSVVSERTVLIVPRMRLTVVRRSVRNGCRALSSEPEGREEREREARQTTTRHPQR